MQIEFFKRGYTPPFARHRRDYLPRNLSRDRSVLVGRDQLRQVFSDTDAEVLWLIIGAPEELEFVQGSKSRMDLARKFYALQRLDSRLGFEASNRCFLCRWISRRRC